jgi:hypothetical protein
VVEQRAKLEFCLKMGEIATATFELMKQAYGYNVLSGTRVFGWYASFQDGRQNLEDDKRSRRPTAIRTPDMIETFRELVLIERQMTIRVMEDTFKISRGTIRKILMEDLGKRKICATFVPHSLTDKQKALRLQTSQECIQSVDVDRSLLDSVVMGNETWCFQYHHQTKTQRMEWRSPGSPTLKSARFQKERERERDFGHILRQSWNNS